MKFGGFVRAKRLEQNLSLRKFCNVLQIDPSNWSKIERGVLPLTTEENKLKEMIELLKLSEEDTERFKDLAMLARKEIPEKVYSDQEILDALPVLFRAADGQRPTRKQREMLIKLIKRII